MSGLTNALVAQQVQALLDTQKRQTDYLTAWLGGSPDGGPNNDGRYPFVDLAGVEILVPAPATFNNKTSGPAALAVAARVAAELARDLSKGHADRANDQRILAEAARGAAIDARNLAQEHKNRAGTSEANAEYWANLARASGQGSSEDREIVEQLAEQVADNAALASQDADEAAASAALAATFDPALYDQKSDTIPSSRLTGVIDIARIPVLPSQLQFVSSGGLANLTTAQKNGIGRGSIVTTTDGFRYVYSGDGSKTSAASYTLLADITPAWDSVTDKPAYFPSNVASVAGLQSALDGKSATGHGHAMSEVTGLVDTLSAKANLDKPTFTGNASLDGAAASERAIYLKTANSNRWRLSANASAEIGADGGTNLTIDRYSDAGARIGTALSIARNTGLATFSIRPLFAGNTPWDSGNFTPSNYAAASHTHDWSVIAGKPSIFASNIANVAGLQSALDAKFTNGGQATVSGVVFSSGYLYPDGNHSVMKTGQAGSEKYWRFDQNGTLYALNGGFYTNGNSHALGIMLVGPSEGAANSTTIGPGYLEVRSQAFGAYIDLSDRNSAEQDFGGRVQYANANLTVSNGSGGNLVIGAGSVYANSGGVSGGVQSGRILTDGGTEQVMAKQLTFPSAMNPQDGGAGAMLEVRGQGDGYGAWMKFHRPGQYGTYFGMFADGEFGFGGWSSGGTIRKFWTEKNFDPLSRMERFNDGWIQSREGRARFYFASNGRTYFGSADGFQWRDTTDQWIATLDGGGTFETKNTISTLGNTMKIRGGSPTLYFKDTDHRSAMIHVNSNTFHILRGAGSDSEAWETVNGRWPLTINLENNEMSVGGAINAENGNIYSQNYYSTGQYYTGQGQWFRVRGSGSGLYWEDFGGGIHMNDATWVRVYNNKNLYCSAQIRGNTVVGESDRRLKANIAPITDPTSKVEALTGVTFDWKATGVAGMGFIAQDFETVLPTLVTENTDGMKGVEYGPVVALLVEALKETNARVTALESGRV